MTDDEARDQIAAVIATTLRNDDATMYYDAPGSAPGQRYAAALMPTVRALIAEELRAAADEIRTAHVGPPALHHQGARMTARESSGYLRARADDIEAGR